MPSKSSARLEPLDPSPSPLQLISIDEAARRVSLSYWCVRDHILRGHLAAVRLPGRPGKQLHRILIDIRDLEKFVSEHRELRVHVPVPRGPRPKRPIKIQATRARTTRRKGAR